MYTVFIYLYSNRKKKMMFGNKRVSGSFTPYGAAAEQWVDPPVCCSPGGTPSLPCANSADRKSNTCRAHSWRSSQSY